MYFARYVQIRKIRLILLEPHLNPKVQLKVAGLSGVLVEKRTTIPKHSYRSVLVGFVEALQFISFKTMLPLSKRLKSDCTVLFCKQVTF